MNYEGVCLGGPLDGTYIKTESRLHYVHVSKGYINAEELAASFLTDDMGLYHFVEFICQEDKGSTLRIFAYRGLTMQEVADRLAGAYVRNVRKTNI